MHRIATVTTVQHAAVHGSSIAAASSSGPSSSLLCGLLRPSTVGAKTQQQRGSSLRVWNPPSRRKLHSSSALSSQPRISYRVAASTSDKDRPFNPKRNAYSFDPQTRDPIGVQRGRNHLERKLSRVDSGEDAFFVSRVGDDRDAVAFGIADGVGGWAESGVDPADFSHGFCTHMAQAAQDWELPADRLRATALMEAGYEKCLNDKTIVAGGSTASIGIGHENGTVQLANLGDSGFVLFRLAAVHHYSSPQTHAFNAPYQLSVLPPVLRLQAQMFGGRQYEDLPRDANVTNCRLQHGDVLVLATDGVFDNLNNQDILGVVSRQMMNTGAWGGTADMGIGVSDHLDALTQPGGLAALSSSPPSSPGSQNTGDTDIRKSQPQDHHSALSRRQQQQQQQHLDRMLETRQRGQTLQSLVALAVAGEAKVAGANPRRDGPFARESRRFWPWEPWRGGKPDDICVLVVVAVEERDT